MKDLDWREIWKYIKESAIKGLALVILIWAVFGIMWFVKVWL